MTPTTNLGLPIYGANDVPKWDDTNQSFQTLDDKFTNYSGTTSAQLANAMNTIGDNNLHHYRLKYRRSYNEQGDLENCYRFMDLAIQKADDSNASMFEEFCFYPSLGEGKLISNSTFTIGGLNIPAGNIIDVTYDLNHARVYSQSVSTIVEWELFRIS